MITSVSLKVPVGFFRVIKISTDAATDATVIQAGSRLIRYGKQMEVLIQKDELDQLPTTVKDRLWLRKAPPPAAEEEKKKKKEDEKSAAVVVVGAAVVVLFFVAFLFSVHVYLKKNTHNY